MRMPDNLENVYLSCNSFNIINILDLCFLKYFNRNLSKLLVIGTYLLICMNMSPLLDFSKCSLPESLFNNIITDHSIVVNLCVFCIGRESLVFFTNCKEFRCFLKAYKDI